MEYIEGRDLRQMVTDDGPLECGKAADYISQAAEGLAHAHQAGFVHRDIKPANLLVDPNGVLKILDLGLARFTVEEEQPWQTSEGEQSAVGTADYVAPEQVADSRNRRRPIGHLQSRPDLLLLADRSPAVPQGDVDGTVDGAPQWNGPNRSSTSVPTPRWS